MSEHAYRPRTQLFTDNMMRLCTSPARWISIAAILAARPCCSKAFKGLCNTTVAAQASSASQGYEGGTFAKKLINR